jgi:hypothetical protein
MFRGAVAILMSCSLLTITFRQYTSVPGHSIEQERSIVELAAPLLREESFHYGSRDLALITGASSVLVVAVAMIEALVFD